MKTCNRLDFPEEELVFVLEADYPGLNKNYKVVKGVWQSQSRPPPKDYKYEVYHVPDLKTYLELLRHLEHDPTKCIINGKPKRNWKQNEQNVRRSTSITDKDTKFIMFDIDGMDLEGWTAGATAATSYSMVQNALADCNVGFAKENIEVVIQMTASWGKPGNDGPRLRLIYELDEVINTNAIYTFTKEFNKRYPYLHLDQAIYRPTQIVYTAAPGIHPRSATPTIPERGRAMKSKKSGKLSWDHISHGYDAGYEDIVNIKGAQATPEQDKQFTMLCDKLAENGIIREFDAVTEKAHIFCPWAEEHTTDTGPSATSMWRNSITGHAAIKCQHASHEHKNTKDFIAAWMNEGIVTPQDFQDVTYEDALNDFQGDVETPPGVKSVKLSPIGKKPMHELSMKELKTRFIHDAANDRYIDRLHGRALKRSALDTLAPRVINRNVDPSSKAPYNKVDLVGTEAWNYTDPSVGEEPGLHVDDVTWIPRDDMMDCIIIEKRIRYYNTYYGLPTKAVKGNAELFLNHMRILFPDEEGFQWAMGFFAHMIQRPWEKPTNALLHISPLKGLGRGRLFDMFSNMLGNFATTIPLNKLVDNTSDFNSVFDRKLLIGIEEVKVPPRKRDIANEILKTYITETKMNVNKKYADEREGVPIYNRLFMMSNNLDAIRIDLDDRRMFVYEPPEGYEVANSDHYDAFSGAIERPGFLSAVMYELRKWKIQVYEPFVKPPMTSAKRVMAKATSNALEHVAALAMEEYGPDKFGISKERFTDIISIQAHKVGLDHLLVNAEVQLAQIFATWEFKAPRKRYMSGNPQVIFGKTKTAILTHAKQVNNEMGRMRVANWDTHIDELIVQYIK